MQKMAKLQRWGAMRLMIKGQGDWIKTSWSGWDTEHGLLLIITFRQYEAIWINPSCQVTDSSYEDMGVIEWPFARPQLLPPYGTRFSLKVFFYLTPIGPEIHYRGVPKIQESEEKKKKAARTEEVTPTQPANGEPAVELPCAE